MTEYLNRKAAVKLLRGDCVGKYPSTFYMGLLAAAGEIEKMPAADVVEVPCHCKDCRYNDPSWQLSADSIGCRYWGIYPDPDDWCCKAERKGGE